MDQVRSLAREDIPQVANFYERVKRGKSVVSSQFTLYLEGILFDNPWRDENLPSLVYQKGDGEIVGLLGVVPRRMMLNGRPIKVAICNHLLVDPNSRSTLAGVKLLKTFFLGPQDLSIAEPNQVGRKIWLGLGGVAAPIHSIYWTCPLRPSRFFTQYLERFKLLAPLEFMSRPFSSVADAILARLPQSPFHQSATAFSEDDLSVQDFLLCLSEFSTGQSLRPEYDERSLKWLLDILAYKDELGSLRKVVLRNSAQEIVGWYLYYSNPLGTSQVVQIGARNKLFGEVLDHLFHDAWLHGATAISGQLEPRFLMEFSPAVCLYNNFRTCMVVHSNRPQLLQTIHCGDAFLSRLETEWWIPFHRDTAE